MLIRHGTDPARRHAFADAGVRLIEVAGASAGVDLQAGLVALGTAGITRLLVEGGAQVAAALLRAGLVDRIAWFHAPAVMGGDAWPAVQAFGIDRLDAMPRFIRQRATAVGDDMLTEFVRHD
jgi:diaminohydroxyphosphoribosylaminopyrimidine deaminase/5-amino-6-(5-phosphoribosylamino)uracil reductase